MDWHPLPLADESEISQAFSGSLSQLTEHFAAVNVSKISPTISSTGATRHDLRVEKQSHLPSSVGDCSSTPQKSTSSCSSPPSSKAASSKEADSISNGTSGEAHSLQQSTHTSIESSSRTVSAAPDKKSTNSSLPSEASHYTTSLSSGSKADLVRGDSSHCSSDGPSGLLPDLSVGDITGSTTPGLGADGSHNTNDSTPDWTPPRSYVPAPRTLVATSAHHSSKQWFEQQRQVRVTVQNVQHNSGGQRRTVQSTGVTNMKKERQVAFSERPLPKNPQAPPQSVTAQSAPMKRLGSGPRQGGLFTPSPVLPSLSELRKGPQFVQFFLPKRSESEHSTSTSELSSTLQTGTIESSTVTHTFPSSMDTHMLSPPKDTTEGVQTLPGAGDPSSNTSTSVDLLSQEPISEESSREKAVTMEAPKDLSANVSSSSSSSSHVLSKEATSEESTREVIETLATEAVRKVRSKPTQVVPGRDLAHLDRLWEALLKSPYATTRALHQSASRDEINGIVGRAFQRDSQSLLQMLGSLDVSDSTVIPELDHIKCTCGARESQRAAEVPHPRARLPGGTGAMRKQAGPMPPLEKDSAGSPSLRRAPFPETDVRHVAPQQEAVRRTAKNQAVQTSPSLFQSGAPGQENGLCTPDRWTPLPGTAARMSASESKAVSFTVSHTSPPRDDSSSSTLTPSPCPYDTKGGHSASASSFNGSLAEHSRPQIPTLAPLSLQEACQMYKKAFIDHSQQRQLFLQRARKRRDELDLLFTGTHNGVPATAQGGAMGELHPTTPQAWTKTERTPTTVPAPFWVPVPRRRLGKELQAEMKAKARRYKSTCSAGVGGGGGWGWRGCSVVCSAVCSGQHLMWCNS